MRRIKLPLEMMGATVDLQGNGECAPMVIKGGGLKGVTYDLPVASAQVKSCVLLAGLFAEGRTCVTEPRPCRDHTERMLKGMGVPLTTDGLVLGLETGGIDRLKLSANDWMIPGDFSSAAFWITAAACRKGSEIEIRDVGLNPRRTVLMDVLRRMGAEIHVEPNGTAGGAREWEPLGVIRVKGAALKGTVVAGDEIPGLIDELTLVAVAGALAEGETVVKDAGELRVKESDRIQAMVTCLRAFGVEVNENPDGMVVRGPARLRGDVCVESAGDHRIAMAAAVLGLFAEGCTTINDTACVGTSYPGFWDDLKCVGTG
jgi:3-phosphoshikimate 1-carboxyvinyltransferase